MTNWSKVGGKNAPIKAFLPQTSSGTRQFFLTALGGGTTPITPGACVSDDNNNLEENEGINPVLNSANSIFIYSVGAYLSQAFHSPKCTKTDCGEVGPKTPPCKAAAGQDKFGCDETGVLQLNELGGSKPATPWPPVAKSLINPGFNLAFQRTLYDVVRYDANTSDHIPGAEASSPGGLNLEQFFGKSGWICSNSKAKTDIKNYGFLPTWKLSTCGATS